MRSVTLLGADKAPSGEKMAEILYISERERYNISDETNKLLKEEYQFKGYFDEGYKVTVESVIVSRSGEKMHYTIWGKFGTPLFELDCATEEECEWLEETIYEQFVIPLFGEGKVSREGLEINFSFSPSEVKEYSHVGLDFQITINYWRALTVEELAAVIASVLKLALFIDFI